MAMDENGRSVDVDCDIDCSHVDVGQIPLPSIRVRVKRF